MQKLFVALLAASAAYSVASLLLFEFVYAPSASTDEWVSIVGVACIVAIPYVLMYVALRLTRDDASRSLFVGCSVLVMLVGGVFYSGGFGPNDGEYSLVYILAPIIQAPLVVLTLAVTLWRRRRLGREEV